MAEVVAGAGVAVLVECYYYYSDSCCMNMDLVAVWVEE